MHECDFLILLNQQGLYYNFETGDIHETPNSNRAVAGWTVTDDDRIAMVFISSNCSFHTAKVLRTLTLINGLELDDALERRLRKQEDNQCTLNNSLKP